MAFDWQQFLNLAKTLAGQETTTNEEAKLRSCGSRSYFAAFGHASQYAVVGGLRLTGSGGDHGAVRAYFKNKGNLRVSKALEELRLWRAQCDYEADVPRLDVLAANAIQRAEEVFRLLVVRPTT